ncbi:MAG: hypothetical protein U9R25_15075 [Chloroflexota bacterium]|nr:hypothetical protein [Chloroflexota bacterium]
MSTGDYVRYLRALKGGPTPYEMEKTSGLSSSVYRQIEQRYRSTGSEADFTILAEFFEVPLEEFTERDAWSRKRLSSFLVDAMEQQVPVRFELRFGESISGTVVWSDLGAVMVAGEDNRDLVVQRHMIDRWEALGEFHPSEELSEDDNPEGEWLPEA